ncbi:MAG TPA: prenyltransferase/squalene oxidase repeat-containing protein [Patescibacteria group bacterium]|nr:prenyltransferase/squalene oxidase repeat-containing protein [Patescibacteria group bacterium]
MEAEFLKQSILRTEKFITKEKFRGYDPYDALLSPLFKLPVLNSWKIPRLGTQQVLKRLPVNLRPLLGIEKGYNPVTLGLCLQAYSYLFKTLPEQKAYFRQQAEFCIKEIDRLQSKGYNGACWGYDFDWQARYATIKAYTPTVVATGFITNALFTAYEIIKSERAFELCKSACNFVLKDLNRTEDESGDFCFSYSPNDRQVVLNATMKGARLLAQVYSVTKDEELLKTARKTTNFVANHQHENGSWPYSIGDTRTWADNFHTGYVLDCLDEYEKMTGDNSFKNIKEKGWKYYRANFFEHGEIPKYYDNSLYPIDATACAQSLITLSQFGDMVQALKTAKWIIENMQNADGSVAYQIKKTFKNNVIYMRWSVAWTFLGLSKVLYTVKDNETAHARLD